MTDRNGEPSRRRYREKRDQYRRALEKVKELGMLEAVERNVDEFLHSPNLKVFRYQPRTGKVHLFVELSDGARHPLCGQRIDDTVAAATVLATRKGDCLMCNRLAAEILRRGKT